MCQEEGEGPEKICQVECTKNTQCTGTGSYCELPASGGTQKGCTTSCDPIADTGCPAGTACRIYAANNAATLLGTYCAAIGTGKQGASCTKDSQCAAGYECVGPAGLGDCEFMCDDDLANPPCPNGYTCTDLFATLGSTEYGTCE